MDPHLAAPENAPMWALGTRDFVQYWSAFHIAAGGGNPYDPSLSIEVQRSTGMIGALPGHTWNPPWLLVLLSPILSMEFESASYAWVALSVTLLAAIPFIVAPRNLEPLSRTRFIFLTLLTLLFFPVLDSIKSGQLGVLLAFGVAVLIRGLQTKKASLAGLGLLLLSVKPHLAVMIGVVTLFRLRSEGMMARTIAWGTALFSGLVTVTLLWRGGLVHQWVTSLSSEASIGTSLLEWRTDTLVGFLRGVSLAYFQTPANYLLYAVPVLFVSGVWAISRWFPMLSARSLMLGVAVICPTFAPYGWVSDYSMALSPLLALFLGAKGADFTRAAVLYLLLAIASAPFFFLSSSVHQYVFLFPVLMWFVAIHLIRTEVAAS